MKQKLGEWLIDTSKYIVAGALLVALAGGGCSQTSCLWGTGVVGLLFLAAGLFLQKGSKQKRFDNTARKQPAREKRPSGENRKPERNKGKKRAAEPEHKPNEITVD